MIPSSVNPSRARCGPMGRVRLLLCAVIVLACPTAMISQSARDAAGGDAAEVRAIASGEAQAVNCGDFRGGGAAAARSAVLASDDAVHGLNLADLDRSVNPCDDFHHFADGGWVKNNPVPAAYPSWATFNKLHERNEEALHTILEEAEADRNPKPGSDWDKIGSFYVSCMNEGQIEAAGLQPLAEEFARIHAIKDLNGLRAEIAKLQSEGVTVAFRFSSEQDYKDSSNVIASAVQGGLGLPDRQYYLKDDGKSKALRDGYVRHITNMFRLLGDDEAKAAAEANTVLALETRLSKAMTDRAPLRDPNNRYHKMTIAQVRELTPHFGWEEYFKEAGAPAVSEMNIGQPDYFKELDAAIASAPIEDWKTYLRWHLVHVRAAALPARFVDENFSFFGKALTGAEELLPRWQRCTQATDRALGEALGQFYVQRNFPPEAKAKAQEMLKNLIAALRDDLQTLDWMSPETRKKAVEKLNAIRPKIGYPDKWRDYSAYKVTRGPYVENETRGAAFEFARDMAKIGKPAERTEWTMTPPTV